VAGGALVPPAAVSPSPPAEAPAERAAEEPSGPKPALSGDADRVNQLFARIKADRAAAAAAAPPAPAATPAATPSTDVPPEGVVPTDAAPAAAEVPAQPAPSDEVAEESSRARRDALLEAAEAALVRHLKRALQDEQNTVLDELRRQRRPAVTSVLPPVVEQFARFREAATATLGDAVTAGARFARADDGSDAPDPTITADVATDITADVAAGLATEIAEPLHGRLERSLEGVGTDREPDPAELAEALSSVYRQWRVQEIEGRARHAAAVAFARGAYAAYPEGGPLRWIVDDDGPCPDCDDNALAGSVPKGQEFPTGQTRPPAHPGCRCLLVPTVP
jgi:hypothetical protein